MRQGAWYGTVLAAVLATHGAVAQSSQTTPPATDPQKQQQSPPAKPASAPAADAPAPSAAQLFPFPEDDSKTKEIPELHPAPAPNVPSDARKQFPFPSSGSQPADGGYSSSSDTAPTNPAPGSNPDVPVRHKLELNDVGSSGRIDTARAEEDQRVADFYAKDGNYAGAYLRYKDAVAFSPDDPNAHFGLAEMARKQGKKPEAIEQYNAYLKVDPQGKHTKEVRKALAELQQEAHSAAATGKR